MPSDEKVEKVARAIPDEAVEAALLVFYDGKLTVDEMWRTNGEDLRPAMRSAISAAIAAAEAGEPVAVGVKTDPPVVAIGSRYEPVYRYQTLDHRSFSLPSPPSEVSRDERAAMLLAALPEHKASLHITHNDHKSSYATVEEYLAFLSDHEDEWAAPGQREKAIATNELWELQWYPETPVGFCKIYAADLGSLLTAAIRAGGGRHERATFSPPSPAPPQGS